MWSGDDSEPTFDDVAQLLRWGRAQRISVDSTEELTSLDDDDLFRFSTKRTRPRYKTERRHSNRERRAR